MTTTETERGKEVPARAVGWRQLRIWIFLSLTPGMLLSALDLGMLLPVAEGWPPWLHQQLAAALALAEDTLLFLQLCWMLLIGIAFAVWARRLSPLWWQLWAVPVGMLMCISVWGSYPLRPHVRRAILWCATIKSEGLVRAIQAYQAKYISPPPTLTALVPEFLTAVPQTGMLCNQAYTYRPGAGNRELGDWELEVALYQGIYLRREALLYLPKGDYARRGYSAPEVRRVGGWIYDSQ